MISCFLMIVEVFSLQNFVEMLEDMVIGRWEGRWKRQRRQNFIAQIVQLLKHWSCDVQSGIVLEKNWAHFVDQWWLQALQFLVHLIGLLSILLRCNGFTRVQKTVVDPMGSRLDHQTMTMMLFNSYSFLPSCWSVPRPLPLKGSQVGSVPSCCRPWGALPSLVSFNSTHITWVEWWRSLHHSLWLPYHGCQLLPARLSTDTWNSELLPCIVNSHINPCRWNYYSHSTIGGELENSDGLAHCPKSYS